jgi:hypothetical protein
LIGYSLKFYKSLEYPGVGGKESSQNLNTSQLGGEVRNWGEGETGRKYRRDRHRYH